MSIFLRSNPCWNAGDQMMRIGEIVQLNFVWSALQIEMSNIVRLFHRVVVLRCYFCPEKTVPLRGQVWLVRGFLQPMNPGEPMGEQLRIRLNATVPQECPGRI
jgi:hypothetical protein